MEKKTHHVAYLRLRSQRTQAWLVDPGLRPRLVADAFEQHTNLTEIAVGILSKRYGVPHETKGRRTNPRVNDEIINMRLPIRLWTAIRKAADRNGRRDMDEIRFTLCAHYGLTLP